MNELLGIFSHIVSRNSTILCIEGQLTIFLNYYLCLFDFNYLLIKFGNLLYIQFSLFCISFVYLLLHEISAFNYDAMPDSVTQ